MDKVNKNLNPKFGNEFKEIAHCGGQYSVDVKTSPEGRRSVQFGITHSRPKAASWFGLYVLPEGIPVGCISFVGMMSENVNQSPHTQGCYQIFIGSDSFGMFGHQCQNCKGYWRSKSAPSGWKTTCPYCGFRHGTFLFLTEGQAQYVESCCKMIQNAIYAEKDGEYVINMDEVADAVSKEGIKSEFYYAEETQQNLYQCSACSDTNDILGKYGYCSSCGTYNGLQELNLDLNHLSKRIEEGSTSLDFSSCAKDTVSAFDSFARQIAKQFARRIPMTTRRRNEWERKLFHNLQGCAESLLNVFDIDIFKGVSEPDKEFAIRMFHRRHIYEHNGGEVDEKYIQDSGDKSVRPKQVIRENRETALLIVNIVRQLGKNLLDGFHNIFPAEDKPIRINQDQIRRMKDR